MTRLYSKENAAQLGINLNNELTKKEFEILYELLYPRILGYSLRLTGNDMLAENATQHAFSKLWSNRSTIREKGAIESILYNSAKNKIIDEADKDQRVSDLPLEEVLRAGSNTSSVEETSSANWENNRLIAAINSISDHSVREAIEAHYLYGLTINEMTVQLNISIGIAKKRVRIGLKYLRSVLD